MFKIEYHGFEAWKRARTSYGMYFDAQTGEKKQLAAMMVHKAKDLGIEHPFKGPLGCVSIFYKKYPKSMSKKKRLNAPWWDTKPDADNLEKFLFDTMEKQASLIENDSNICAKLCFKLWGPYDYTVFFLDRWTERSHFIINSDSVGFNGVGYLLHDRRYIKF